MQNKHTERDSWFERHKILATVLIVLGVIVVAGVISSMGSDDSDSTTSIDASGGLVPSSDKIQTYGLNESVQTEGFTYTFHSVRSQSQVGSAYSSENADGVFFIVDLTIENTGNEPDYFPDSIVILDSQGRQFEEDIDAKISYGYDRVFSSLDKLQPGLPKRSHIIFDVPKDTVGKIAIKKSMWSDDIVAYVRLQ